MLHFNCNPAEIAQKRESAIVRRRLSLSKQRSSSDSTNSRAKANPTEIAKKKEAALYRRRLSLSRQRASSDTTNPIATAFENIKNKRSTSQNEPKEASTENVIKIEPDHDKIDSEKPKNPENMIKIEPEEDEIENERDHSPIHAPPFVPRRLTGPKLRAYLCL